MPVNTKVCNYQRDGSMMVHANGLGAPNYFPNSFLGPTPSADGIWHSDSVSGDILRHETCVDNFLQCGEFIRNVFGADARKHLTDNIAEHITCAQEFI
jgi:catalase